MRNFRKLLLVAMLVLLCGETFGKVVNNENADYVPQEEVRHDYSTLTNFITVAETVAIQSAVNSVTIIKSISISISATTLNMDVTTIDNSDTINSNKTFKSTVDYINSYGLTDSYITKLNIESHRVRSRFDNRKSGKPINYIKQNYRPSLA